MHHGLFYICYEIFTKEQLISNNYLILTRYHEFTRGIENVSDREARNHAIENLQKMIRSWLDETHPQMSAKEREHRALTMDMSLIEKQKAESLNSIYELNNVVRMSFIEAQFIKKVRRGSVITCLLKLSQTKQ